MTASASRQRWRPGGRQDDAEKGPQGPRPSRRAASSVPRPIPGRPRGRAGRHRVEGQREHGNHPGVPRASKLTLSSPGIWLSSRWTGPAVSNSPARRRRGHRPQGERQHQTPVQPAPAGNSHRAVSQARPQPRIRVPMPTPSTSAAVLRSRLGSTVAARCSRQRFRGSPGREQHGERHRRQRAHQQHRGPQWPVGGGPCSRDGFRAGPAPWRRKLGHLSDSPRGPSASPPPPAAPGLGHVAGRP